MSNNKPSETQCPAMPDKAETTVAAARAPANAGPAVKPDGAKPAEKDAKPRKKRRVGRIVAIVCGCVVVLLVAAVLVAYQWLSNQVSGENTPSGDLSDETTTETIPEYTGKDLICGLICGIDYNNETADGYLDETDKIGNTDLILYLMYDTVAKEAHILQIPRDVYVGDELDTGNKYRINAIYRNSADPDNRMAALVDVIYDQLALPVDFYVTIDMDGVKEIVDIIDGSGEFLVYVPQDVVDPDHPDIVLEQGWRAFTGEEADFFLRNRNYADADITRLSMQQHFYSALFREFKQLSSNDLLMWMKVLLWRVKLGGIGPLDMGGLAQEALGLEADNLVFVRPSITGAQYRGESLVSLVPEETAELLNAYFRPEGHVVPVEDLNIQTLPMDEKIGKAEAAVVRMSDIQEGEPAA